MLNSSLYMKKHLLIAFLLVAVPLYPYNFTRLDNTHGLSNNQIESIFKDSRGFMWFGTNYGLNRYDGYQFKVYKTEKNDSTSLSFNSISEIQEDVIGNLWLRGTPGYTVYDVRTERFIRDLSVLLKPLGITFIPALVEIDSKKNYYFYQPNTGVFKWDVGNRKLTTYKQGNGTNSLSRGNIIGMRTGEDCFWVLFESGLLERYNELSNSVDFRNTHIVDCIIGSSIPKNLYIDREGCPWVFPGRGDRGVLYYNFKKSDWIYFGSNRKDFQGVNDQLITTDFVRDVAQEQNGKVWIATDHGGINIYDKRNGRITVLLNDVLNPNSISQNSVISLFADNNGIMWTGTYKNGISYYHEGMFKFEKSPLFFYQHPLLENKDCNILHEDSRGDLWIGTNGSGLLKYDAKTNRFNLYRHMQNDPGSISSDIIISSLEDHSGKMWFGTFLGGLNRMEGNRFVQYQPNVNNPNSLSNKSIYGLVEDQDRNIWIGTLGGGVDRLDATRQNFRRHDLGNMPDLSSNFILSMFSKSPEQIYLSTSLGLDVLSTRTSTIAPVFKEPHLRDKLSDQVIIHSYVDSRNHLWIATDNGINIYNPDNDSIYYINKSNGLPSEQVVSLVEDDEGHIWAGTRNGLARITETVDPSSGITSFEVISFDENDGLVNTIFNQNAVFKNKEGKIFFGSTKGYTVFDPRSISFNATVPKPSITGLMIANEEVLPGKAFKNRVILDESVTHQKRLTLNYDEKNFSIQFSALSYIHPEKNQYRYMLKGLDNTWIETRKGEVTYSNLSQGKYELIVYASNNDNVWSTNPLVLEIVIRPPFWLTWWALLIYVMIGFLLVRYVVRYKLRKQKQEFENEQRIREAKQLHEMDEMRFRFFTNISHEFRTPLTLIINPAEKLLQQSTTEEQTGLLDIIRRNANGLLDLVNQLLDFRKLDVQQDMLHLSVGDVVAFVKDVCYSFTDLANRKSIQFLFSSSVSDLRMEFDPEKLRKIVFNLLSNAFKYTRESGKINVQLSLIQQMNGDSKLLKIVVSDTGIGIPVKDQARIFERFYRVDNNENGHQTGTGVGLHLVSEYVKLHEGEISVDSTPGKGSTFTVLLPATQHIEQEVIANSELIVAEELVEETVQEERKGKLPLLLIVDDNVDFRNFISGLFKDSYRILLADDGVKALKLALTRMPDLIISDVMMPNMNGYELCQNLKQDIRVSHIPIILLTAKSGDENKYLGLESGAEDYISKPFKMEILALKVNRIIERQRQKHDQFRNKVDINPSEVEITSMDEKFVKKAVALVETNISNTEFLVEDLCREMGMSRVYFYKKILSLTDKTPSEFIRFIRLKRAADILEKDQLFVNEVAYQVGFSDARSFRKHFKDEFGVSPSDYKKQS